MTALRRSAPVRAPRVSSSAVGSNSPVPSRPRVSRSSHGSIRQTVALHIAVVDSQVTKRLLASRAQAR